MKHTTKILAVILSVCMLLGFMPAISFADDYGAWAVYNDTDKTLTFCVGTKTDAGIVRNEESTISGDVYYSDFETQEFFYETIPWRNEWTKITEIVFLDEITPISTCYWFINFQNLVRIINIEKLNTSQVTNMRQMFQACSSLTELDLSSFDTRNVTSMHGMFGDCSSLVRLNLNGFCTSNVTDMGWMFGACSALSDLDVTGFDTSNVNNMWQMFILCSNITQLDVTHFNTENVTNMQQMFDGCSGLTVLDVTHFNTGNVTNMRNMFYGCSGLTELDVTHFNTGNVTDMGGMFCGCSGLTELDVTHYNTSNVTDMRSMFSGCSGLTEIDVTHFDTSNVTDMRSMFSGCSGLSELDVTHFNTGNVTNMNYMFSGCSGLTKLDLSHFDTSNVTKMSQMFYGCSGLTELDISHFNTENVDNMKWMFMNCSNLTSLDVSHFNTSKVSDMSNMFSSCSNLTALDVSHFNTNNVQNMFGMFYCCSGLTALDVSHFNTENVTNMGAMFSCCSNVTELDLKHFNTVKVENMSCMFDSCNSLILMDVSSFNTHNTQDMISMFLCCRFSSIILGSDFVANENEQYSVNLPVPDGSSYTGYWISEQHPGMRFTSAELMENYDGATMAGTWVWETLKDLNDALILPIPDQDYTGSEITPAVTINYLGTTLTENTDYTLSYSNNVNPGQATVTVTGISPYAGTISVNFNIIRNLSGAVVSAADQDFTGSALTPDVTVTLDGDTLSPDTDYDLVFVNNTDPGAATVIVTGKGYYEGMAYGTFRINQDAPVVPDKTDLSGALVSAADQDYTGSALTPAVTVTLNGSPLEEGTDFTVRSYERNTNVGTAVVFISGIGDYEGVAYGTFLITENVPAKTDLSAATVSAADQDYTGSALTPAVTVTLNGNTLTENTDYNLVYVNNTEAGSATVIITGTGDYEGMAYGTFRITREEPVVTPKTDLSTATVSAADQNYSGSALTPAVTVTLNGSDLDEGTDYNLVYVNNTDAGAATVIVTGTGDYEGMAYGTFRITKEEPVVTPKTDLSEATVTADDQGYTGEAMTPEAFVTLHGSALRKGTDYRIVYVNNENAGTAVVIAVGIGDYTGMAYGTFAITGEGADDPTPTEPSADDPADSAQIIKQFSILDVMKRLFQSILNAFQRVSG